MAPPLSSVSTTASWPAITAIIRSGWPLVSIWLGFSPLSSAWRTFSSSPSRTALTIGFSVKPSNCANAGAAGRASVRAKNVRRIMRSPILFLVATRSFRARGVAARRAVTRLDAIPDLGLQRHPVEPVDLLQAGRRGDVDLGEPVADHVDADEDHAEPRQFRSDGVADLAVALAELGLHRFAADMHVGARLAFGRHAIDDADRLAVDQDDALVALAHLGKIALGDQRLAAALREHLEQRGEILVVGPDAEHARAAIAEQRLQDDVLVLGAEIAQGAWVGGDQRRRHDIVEVRDE